MTNHFTWIIFSQRQLVMRFFKSHSGQMLVQQFTPQQLIRVSLLSAHLNRSSPPVQIPAVSREMLIIWTRTNFLSASGDIPQPSFHSHRERGFGFTAQVPPPDLLVLPTLTFPWESAKSGMTGAKSHRSHKRLSIHAALLRCCVGCSGHERNCQWACSTPKQNQLACAVLCSLCNSKHDDLAPSPGSLTFCRALFKALPK